MDQFDPLYALKRSLWLVAVWRVSSRRGRADTGHCRPDARHWSLGLGL